MSMSIHEKFVLVRRAKMNWLTHHGCLDVSHIQHVSCEIELLFSSGYAQIFLYIHLVFRNETFCCFHGREI